MTEDEMETIRSMLAGIRNVLQRRYILELLKADKDGILTRELRYQELDSFIGELVLEIFERD